MPTLFRLITVIAAAVALTYGAMLALVVSVQPQQREIVEAANLPAGVELRTGRSVAATLNSQAAALVQHRAR